MTMRYGLTTICGIVFLAGCALSTPPIYNIATFSCDDHTEFTATFYNGTTPQTAQIDYQGKTETFTQTRTASGVRYEGKRGRYFWNKGNNAMFRWDMGKPYVNCHVTSSRR